MREVHLLDDDVAILSIARQIRIMHELIDSLTRNLPGTDAAMIEAAAQNLSCAWGDFGVKEN